VYLFTEWLWSNGRYHQGMFSYRHAFHAGNHADVLKHTVLVAMMKHLTEKDAALTVLDTHAGAGLYRLDGDYAQTSGEAADGILRLVAKPVSAPKSPSKVAETPARQAQAATKKIVKVAVKRSAALQDYLDLVATFNSKDSFKIYPGSPFIIQRFLAGRDKLKAFELHPTDAKTLAANIAQLEAGRQVVVLKEDGFEGIKKFLPPPVKRALVFCDPSYEIKSDYARVAEMVADSLKRFATGTYAVWYPIIPRPEAHDVPRKLKTLATKADKPWLNAVLTVKSSKLTADEQGETVRPGLPASGMFIINPPYTLKAALQAALPDMVAHLAQDQHAAFTLDSGG
jgi:23S rRNA (adenine2030-N6)-methyltransferase